MQQCNRLKHYARLMRWDKPIGIFLLLWPTLSALWLAGNGHPDGGMVAVFIVGVILMRSAGCVVNDLVDRRFDGKVRRTQARPLITGDVSIVGAGLLSCILALAAFLLVCFFCNTMTVQLAFVGALLAGVYPFLKRVTHLPQCGLGLAFAWGVPMAFAAETNQVSGAAWLYFAAALIWPIMYDTAYAMADREDDIKIGVKSTAILLGSHDRWMIGLLQVLFLFIMMMVGSVFQLQGLFNVSIAVAGILFLYQQWLIKDRDPGKSFQAFLNNHWVGFVLFLGIVFS